MFILRLETFARVTDPKAINAVSTLSVAGQVWMVWIGGVGAKSIEAEDEYGTH